MHRRWQTKKSARRHMRELPATNNALVRSYVWGLDLSGTLEVAGGVGGLLWISNFHSPIGTHFVGYDGNGNVVALVSATTGTETARYEYGPFGEPIRVSGSAASLNPFRFSTKRTCNTTDLVLYEYRAYSPGLGRWLSRDPIELAGVYNYLANDCLGKAEILGLWNEDIHYTATGGWAVSLGITLAASEQIARSDNRIDSDYTTLKFSEANWSWHFDRSKGGEDSRVPHAYETYEKAQGCCNWEVGQDDWKCAARELGMGLHALQDWVAHGDFNRWQEAPNIERVPWWPPSARLQYRHNEFTPIRGQDYRTVDDWMYDSCDLDGRPTLECLVFAKRTEYGDNLFWAPFVFGLKRLWTTEALTLDYLRAFQEFVRAKGKPCGQCRHHFLGE